MVSFSVEDSHQGGELARHRALSTGSPPTAPEYDYDDDSMAMDGQVEEQPFQGISSKQLKSIKQQQQQRQQSTSPQPNNQDDNSSSGEPDDEQLRRILMCKRLSEGCNKYVQMAGGGGQAGQGHLHRKNSLHMIGEELPPVTEGEAMRHKTPVGRPLQLTGGANMNAIKRNSHDDTTTSCSSSTSLDGPAGSGSGSGSSRRRSSTVSQCSSVLSEGARQQLNFDLSPDLAPDCSLLEANAVSPTELDDRPASPEPSSLASGDDEGGSSFELRPISRMSQCAVDGFTLPLAAVSFSPDSPLGHSNEQPLQAVAHPDAHQLTSETSRRRDSTDNNSNNMERLISHVSTVKVSNETQPGEDRDDDDDDHDDHHHFVASNQQQAQKRAHFPADDCQQQQHQRSKWSQPNRKA